MATSVGAVVVGSQLPHNLFRLKGLSLPFYSLNTTQCPSLLPEALMSWTSSYPHWAFFSLGVPLSHSVDLPVLRSAHLEQLPLPRMCRDRVSTGSTHSYLRPAFTSEGSSLSCYSPAPDHLVLSKLCVHSQRLTAESPVSGVEAHTRRSANAYRVTNPAKWKDSTKGDVRMGCKTAKKWSLWAAKIPVRGGR